VKSGREYLHVMPLTGFYNRDGENLLRGTNWVFMHNSGGQFFTPIASTASITLPMLHTHFHRHTALTRRTKERSLETLQKPMLFRTSVSSGQN